MQRPVVNTKGPKPVMPCHFPGCKATFRKPLRLKEHMFKHTGQKAFRCDKAGCGRSFTRKAQLQSHLLKHVGVKKFACQAPGCRMAFVTKESLKCHQKYKHGKTAPLKCSVAGCSKTFQKKKALKNHVSEHKGEPLFGCDHPACKWKGYSSASLAGHRRRHGGYRCPFPGCQTTHSTWSALQKHRKSHPLNLPCRLCKKPFKKESVLRRHKLTHLDRKISLTCPREDCKQTFTTVFNLTHHVRKNHLCLQPYHCYHAGCTRTFAMRESLVRHLVVHDPARQKLQLKFNMKPSKKHLRKLLRSRPSVEQDLSRLFNQKLAFKGKTCVEANLSILFNERLFRDPAEPEVNLTSLFHLPPAYARQEKAA